MPLEANASAQALRAEVNGLVSRGVSSAAIVSGHLILTLTDNSAVDLGQVVAEQSMHAPTHALGGVDALSPAAIGAAAATHGHAQSEVTGLAAALSGKAAATHGHTQAQVDGLSSALDQLQQAAAGHAANHAALGADALSPADIGAATAAEYTATLLCSGWSAAAPYTQSVAVLGLPAEAGGMADADVSAASDPAAGLAILEGWGRVSRVYASAADTLTAVCYETKPETDIPLRLTVISAGGAPCTAQTYSGEYSVTPSGDAQTLETDGLLMENDVSVEPIPSQTVSNEHGETVIIG